MRRNTDRANYFNDLAIKARAEEEEQERKRKECEERERKQKEEIKQAALNMRQMLIDRKNKKNLGIDESVHERIKAEQKLNNYQKIIKDYEAALERKSEQLDHMYKLSIESLKQEADELLARINETNPDINEFIAVTEEVKLLSPRADNLADNSDFKIENLEILTLEKKALEVYKELEPLLTAPAPTPEAAIERAQETKLELLPLEPILSPKAIIEPLKIEVHKEDPKLEDPKPELAKKKTKKKKSNNLLIKPNQKKVTLKSNAPLIVPRKPSRWS
jgi:hypothetical protein